MKYTKLVLMACVLLWSCGGVFEGPKGSPGIAGLSGVTGATGAQGLPGTSCSVVPDPSGAAIVCPGSQTVIIDNGSPGTDGTDGKDASPCTVSATGSSGATITCPDGSESTIAGVTMVQFCSNYTTTYPSSFPEFGFCIGGVLYATYWNGSQAFTAEVVPGLYESTSPQGCTFTVYANCEVVDQ